MQRLPRGGFHTVGRSVNEMGRLEIESYGNAFCEAT